MVFSKFRSFSPILIGWNFNQSESIISEGDLMHFFMLIPKIYISIYVNYQVFTFFPIEKSEKLEIESYLVKTISDLLVLISRKSVGSTLWLRTPWQSLRQHEWDSNTRYRYSKRFWDGVPFVKGYMINYFMNLLRSQKMN